MRRSHASWLAYAGGDATAACGHLDATVTRQHYLDPTICGQRHAERLPFRLLDLATPETHQ